MLRATLDLGHHAFRTADPLGDLFKSEFVKPARIAQLDPEGVSARLSVKSSGGIIVNIVHCTKLSCKSHHEGQDP